MWNTSPTNADGPYGELMAAAFSDNEPGYRIAPGRQAAAHHLIAWAIWAKATRMVLVANSLGPPRSTSTTSACAWC